MVEESMGLLGPEGEHGVSSHLAQLADGVGKLFAHHLQLARLEFAQDARALGASAGKLAAFAALGLVGYALSMVALALFLGRRLEADAAFALVALANLALAGAGAYLAVRKARQRQLLGRSLEELKSSVAIVKPPESSHAR